MMSNQEILEKAITKAIEGGWDYKPMLVLHQENIATDKPAIERPIGEHALFLDIPLLQSFARALWGEDEHNAWTDENGGTVTCTKCDGGDVLGSKTGKTLKEPWVTYGIGYCWEWHLQQMVIADDPVEYLGNNI